MNSPHYLYRCDHARTGDQAVVYVHRHPVTKVTAKGWWIDVYGKKRWVARDGTKRFALPTKEEAAQSFQCRKRRQIEILHRQISGARIALEKDPKTYIDCFGLDSDTL